MLNLMGYSNTLLKSAVSGGLSALEAFAYDCIIFTTLPFIPIFALLIKIHHKDER